MRQPPEAMNPRSAISRRLLYLIVFIEGFCSLGAEVIALRQIIPHVGSSIVVTAPTIGFFLLALALGYHAGAKVDADYPAVVAKNFLIAALLVGVGLAGVTVNLIFEAFPVAAMAYLVFVGFVLCPVAWLMGQTVPVLSNLFDDQRVGAASGHALTWSTLGSFLGSITLSLLVMQWLGVSAAVGLCGLFLLAGHLVLLGRNWRAAWAAASVLLATVAANAWLRPVIDTAYASYAVVPVTLAGSINPRAFKNNNSVASLIDESEPPHYARYVDHIRGILLDGLGFREREILVLGAGGFTMSHREPANRYTYVNIDPAIRQIAEQRFLREPALGQFIADDARRFVKRSERRFDALVVDVFSSHTAIPAHLVTREFWQSTRRVLTADGAMIANLILDPRLATAYAHNMLATIESVYGRCAVEVLQKQQPLSNVVVTCRNDTPPQAASVYVNELNPADFDLARSR